MCALERDDGQVCSYEQLWVAGGWRARNTSVAGVVLYGNMRSPLLRYAALSLIGVMALLVALGEVWDGIAAAGAVGDVAFERGWLGVFVVTLVVVAAVVLAIPDLCRVFRRAGRAAGPMAQPERVTLDVRNAETLKVERVTSDADTVLRTGDVANVHVRDVDHQREAR